MPIANCPISGCDYATTDLSDAIVAAILTTLSVTHGAGSSYSATYTQS